jgi:hypothetical protein
VRTRSGVLTLVLAHACSPSSDGLRGPERSTAALTSSAVVSVGTKATAAGFGYQQHVARAENDQRYWLFYVDDTAGVIKTMTSSDLTTWSPGAAISLTAGFTLADGNNFSVAYANRANVDVFHLVANAKSGSRTAALHIRATLDAGALTASAPSILPDTDTASGANSPGDCPQEGPTTLVTGDGRVFDVTAWMDHTGPTTWCDTNIYLAPGTENGTSWNSAAFTHDGYFIVVPGLGYAHALVDLPQAGNVLALWPDEDTTSLPTYNGVGWALSPTFDGGAPGTPGIVGSNELFADSGTIASYNDWSVCRLSDTDVHVIRHVMTDAGLGGGTDSFQEMVFDGGTWQAVPPPPSVAGAWNSGLVLLSDLDPADGLLMVTLGSDHTLNVARWTSSMPWTSVATLPGGTPRTSLSGTGCSSAHPLVFWIEGSTPTFTLMTADLSGFLVRPDAGQGPDGGFAPDAGPTGDGGTRADAGAAHDGGVTSDAGTGGDGGVTPDGGSAHAENLEVGCGCATSPALWLGALGLLRAVTRKRIRRA